MYIHVQHLSRSLESYPDTSPQFSSCSQLLCIISLRLLNFQNVVEFLLNSSKLAEMFTDVYVEFYEKQWNPIVDVHRMSLLCWANPTEISRIRLAFSENCWELNQQIHQTFISSFFQMMDQKSVSSAEGTEGPAMFLLEDVRGSILRLDLEAYACSNLFLNVG